MRGSPPRARWLGRLGWRLVVAFTAVAVGAVGLLAYFAVSAVRREVADLLVAQRQASVEQILAALQDAYVAGGSWQQVDISGLTGPAGESVRVVVTDPQGTPVATGTPRPAGPSWTAGPVAPESTGPAGSPSGRVSGPSGSATSAPRSSGANPQGPGRSASAVATPASPTGGQFPQRDVQPDALAAAGDGHTLLAARAGALAVLAAADGSGTVEVPVIVDGQQVGLAVIELPPDSASLQWQAGADVQRSILLGALLAVLLAVSVAVLVAHRITRPLTALTSATRGLAHGDWQAASTLRPGPGEIGELGRSFAAMAAVIQREDELRRAVVADVAHELRTPVTILRGQTEAVLDGVSAPDRAMAESLHEEVLRLGRLVEDLATLSSAEAAGLRLQLQAVRLDQLVSDVVALMGPQLAAAGLTAELALEPVEVRADPSRLAQVLTNLLSNAAKYSPDGGRVRCRLAAESGQAVLEVVDSGPGIPPADLPKVFERFWRGPAAGARSGSGIGLAVVAELVAAHGGTVQASSPPGAGARFTVRLPLPGQQSSAGEPGLSRR